jgi:hypothetical protein
MEVEMGKEWRWKCERRGRYEYVQWMWRWERIGALGVKRIEVEM